MRQKITVTRGRSKAFKLYLTDESGNAYTLSNGEKLLFGVKAKPEDEALLIQKTITECENGVSVVAFTPNDTINLKFGRYVYDISHENGENLYDVVKTSPFVIAPNVTKRGDGE